MAEKKDNPHLQHSGRTEVRIFILFAQYSVLLKDEMKATGRPVILYWIRVTVAVVTQ